MILQTRKHCQWGDDSSETARKRAEVVDRLCETLAKNGWNIIRDKNAMRSGDLISGFMKRIGVADHVIVVLSDKYLLRSPYCMAELYGISNDRLEKKRTSCIGSFRYRRPMLGSAPGVTDSYILSTGGRSSRR